jgi:type IV pilus assembly protein PilC
MNFRYKALKENKIVKGKIEAENLQDAVTLLKNNKYFPIEVEKDENKTNFSKELLNGVGFNDIVNFTRQLAIMLNAGLTLLDCFEILRKQTTKKSLLDIINDVEQNIREGKNFSDALKRHKNHFSNLYIALVKSGEASGKLNDILQRLAENLENEREFRGKIRGALVYPALIVVGMLGVMFVMVTFVLPRLLSLYTEFNIKLPLSTQILIWVSSFSAQYWPIIIGVVFVAIMLVRQYLKTTAGKFTFDVLILQMPVIGNVVKVSSLVDATRALSILIGSGVSILEGLNIVTDITDNLVYQHAFKNIYKEVEKGVSFGTALADEGIFPPILVQMTTVGEQTGHLDETLARISHYFEVEWEITVKAVPTLIDPAILVVLGVAVGFLVVTIITPIYNLTNSFNQ